MAQIRNILVVPEDYNGGFDPAVDEVRIDPDVEKAHTIQEVVSDSGEGVLDRNLVTDEKKQVLTESIADYTTSKDSGDTAGQLDALERAVTHMWDVVSGDDLGSSLLGDETSDSGSTDTTNDSTSA